jgi:hypothetical protein
MPDAVYTVFELFQTLSNKVPDDVYTVFELLMTGGGTAGNI